MNDKERNLQHAMMSFALWGGMLVNTKQMNPANNRTVEVTLAPGARSITGLRVSVWKMSAEGTYLVTAV